MTFDERPRTESENLIPYGRQSIDELDIQAVIDVLRSDFLTTGPLIAEFEAELCRVTGSPFATATSSGTSALHLAYLAAGIKPGDEVITSSLTFAATANAAIWSGATPVFADIERDTGNLDIDLLERLVTDRTKAIVAVDYAGHPVDYQALSTLSQRLGIATIADAAHSLGATYGGVAVGQLASLTTLSFHPVKAITTGEGGAVLTDNFEIARSISELRNHGIVKDPLRLTRNEGPWFYEVQELGLNYRITDIQCALGMRQLKKLRRFVERRQEIAERYMVEFAHLSPLILPTVRPEATSAWHLFVLRLRDPRRRLVFYKALRSAGIGVQVHYLPVYLHPLYQRMGYKRGLCPNAEEFYSQAVSIPIFPQLTDGQVDRVVRAVSRAAGLLLT